MAIGQITISAADWIAARVTDRMAITVAASRIDEQSQLGGGAAVASADDSGRSELEQRRQQRSLLAAQESYRKVAARIKARLADRSQSEPLIAEEAVRTTDERKTLFDGLRDNSKLLATLIATDAQTDRTRTRTTHADTDLTAFGTGEQKPFGSPDAQEDATASSAIGEGSEPDGHQNAWEAAEARADAIAEGAVLRQGLWADLFEPADEPTDHIPHMGD